MKIALIGYGKMGRSLEKVAEERQITIGARIHSHSGAADWSAARQCDLCIEFTHPRAAAENILRIAEMGKPMVVGTTGWDSELDKVKRAVDTHRVGCICSPNFAVGIYLFTQIVSQAAKLIHPFDRYDTALVETHHNQKVDRPSGTALKIAGAFEDEIPISSIRVGSAPGSHQVIFDSKEDTITLTHEVRDRSVFAKGAMDAAQWIFDKQGFFTMDDMMKELACSSQM